MYESHCRRAIVLGALMIIPWTVAAESATAGVVPADPSLIQFVQSVVEANPRVRAANAVLEASDASLSAASRPLYNPELSLDAENSDAYTLVLGISQTLDWSGKRKARTTVAESDRFEVRAEYLVARWTVTLELLNGLAQYQTGAERNALAQSRQSLMDEFANLSQRRFDAGDLAQVELNLAHVASAAARIQSATAAAGVAEARQVVRNLMAQSASDKWPKLAAEVPILPKSAEDTQLLVLALPEVLVARQKVETANAVVELRRRERRPDPTLSLAGGEEDGETLIGLNLTIPLYVRNRFDHEVNAALAQRSQAQQLADDVMQRAYARLIGATERYRLSRGAWENWQQTGETSLSLQTEQLQRLWESGELSTADYLVQVTATLDVQERALDLREAVWRSWFEWLRASGQVGAWLGQGAER